MTEYANTDANQPSRNRIGARRKVTPQRWKLQLPRGNIARIIVRKVFTGWRAATEKPAAHNLCYVNANYTLCTMYVRNTGSYTCSQPRHVSSRRRKALVCAGACEIHMWNSGFSNFRFYWRFRAFWIQLMIYFGLWFNAIKKINKILILKFEYSRNIFKAFVSIYRSI